MVCKDLQEAGWLHGYRAVLRMERFGFAPWPGTLCNVLSTTHFILTVPLSNLVYKCVPANLMLCDEASTPPGGAEIPKKPLLKLTRDMEDPPGYV